MDFSFETMFAGCFGDERREKRGLYWRKGWFVGAPAWFAGWAEPAPELLGLHGF